MRQAHFFLVAEDGLHPWQGRNRGRGSLGITAGDPKGQAGVLPGQAAHGLAGLLVGPGSDGAGIHHYQVRDRVGRGGTPALGRELLSHAGAVTLVHLAAEGNDAKGWHK